MINRLSPLLVLLAVLSLPMPAAAQAQFSASDALDLLSVVDEVLHDPSDLATEADIAFDPGELLAVNISDTALQLAATLGLDLIARDALPGLGLSMVRLRLPKDLARANALMKQLMRIDPLGLYGRNSIYRLAGAPAAACEGTRCYGQALTGWPVGGCSRAVRIGMLDSAVDAKHPALRGQTLVQERIAERRPKAIEQDHGTAIAAQLIGNGSGGVQGLLPRASLYAADVFELDRESRPYTDAYRLIRGLDWLARQKLDSLNISIAGPDSPLLHRAVQILEAQGVAIAAAAGNLGPTAPAQYPAAYPEVLAVAAVDREFRPYARGNQGAYVGIAAPGVTVWTAGAGNVVHFRDGSSHASPWAAASLALLRREPTERGNVQVAITALKRAARDLGVRGADPVFGAGLLQLPAGACAVH